jgi:hypothetical protein
LAVEEKASAVDSAANTIILINMQPCLSHHFDIFVGFMSKRVVVAWLMALSFSLCYS